MGSLIGTINFGISSESVRASLFPDRNMCSVVARPINSNPVMIKVFNPFLPYRYLFYFFIIFSFCFLLIWLNEPRVTSKSGSKL